MIIKNNTVIYAMDKNNAPVARAKSGDNIVFETLDCFSCSLTSEEQKLGGIDFNKVNPATGPVYIEDARAGDVLKVFINKINIEDFAVSVAEPGFGRLGERVSESKTRIIKVDNEKIKFQGIEFPINKMIGVIGTAPAGEAVNTGTPGDHGGNLDCKEITEGATLYLPVEVDGALLAIGDLHAAMGDGEISGAAAEISGSVDVVVEVIKDFKYKTPMIETDDKFMMLASRESIDEATNLSLANMAELIMDKKGLSFEDAYILMSLAVDVRACQIVNPNVTMRAEIKKEILR